MFSLSAPTHPVNPMRNVMAPAQMKINAGSKATLVNRDKLLNVSFSVHAQTPIAKIPRPSSCKAKCCFDRIVPIRIFSVVRSYPKNDVESEDDILEATRDFALVSP